jgi:hypothetical protein
MTDIPYGETADQARIDATEHLRREALSSQNGLEYRYFSDKLGISEHSIEDPYLHERGQVDVEKATTKQLTELDKKVDKRLAEMKKAKE